MRPQSCGLAWAMPAMLRLRGVVDHCCVFAWASSSRGHVVVAWRCVLKPAGRNVFVVVQGLGSVEKG
eukprot:7154614-Alexandrium_andersonii.AAC.1